MQKLKFKFVIKPSEDPKINVLCVTAVSTKNDHDFFVPELYQLDETLWKLSGSEDLLQKKN